MPGCLKMIEGFIYCPNCLASNLTLDCKNAALLKRLQSGVPTYLREQPSDDPKPHGCFLQQFWILGESSATYTKSTKGGPNCIIFRSRSKQFLQSGSNVYRNESFVDDSNCNLAPTTTWTTSDSPSAILTAMD